jgi:RNA polymerase primary sigma factor
MALSDRVQEGNIGLMKAVDRFDPSRGVRFSTYAAWWIRHTVTRALVNRGRLVRIPAHLHTVFTKYRSVRRELRGGLGREPSLEEIAARIDVSLTKLTKAVDAMQAQTVEFEAPAGTIEARNTPDLSRASTPPDPGHELDLRRNLDVTQRAISKLDPLELDVIYHRFGLEGAEPLTLQRLGERHALSRERIRQLQNRALEKLKGIVEKDPTPSIAPLVA